MEVVTFRERGEELTQIVKETLHRDWRPCSLPVGTPWVREVEGGRRAQRAGLALLSTPPGPVLGAGDTGEEGPPACPEELVT